MDTRISSASKKSIKMVSGRDVTQVQPGGEINHATILPPLKRSFFLSLPQPCNRLEYISIFICPFSPVPVPARSKAWVYGRSPAEIVGSNPTGGMGVCLLWVLCVVR